MPALNSLSEKNSVKVSTKASSRRKVVGRIGPWQLVKLLNEGPQTRVYHARPNGSNQEVPAAYVLKVLRKEFWKDRHAVEMHQREAWIGSKVSHPNLLPVLSSSVQQAPYFIITPRLNGTTLDKVIESGKLPSIPVVLWIIRQVAEALDALHNSTEMIHADVKPENIFVTADGHTTLLDYGFAHKPYEANSWTKRPVVGTLNYLAPEVVTSTLSSNRQSDLYSLGVTFYELLSGELPYQSNDPATLLTMHREAKPISIREHCPELSKEIAELVESLLLKDPLRRPESAAMLAEQLIRLEIDTFALRA